MNHAEEQIKSVVIGHAVADALGVPVEFYDRAELKESPVTEMRGYGTYLVPAGAWSDDTSMSVAALDAVSDGTFSPDRVMQAFTAWYETGKYTPTGEMFDIGNTCRRAIENYTRNHKDAAMCGIGDEYSNGNGSLMRIHPFALMTWFDEALRPTFETVIETASALTHAHPRSKLACDIYTLILFALLAHPEKDAVTYALETAKQKYCDHPEIPHFERLLARGFDRCPEEEIRSGGYVVDTLEAAVWCLLTTDSYRACVLKAVNLGADTDTTVAVAGGLAGALYGYHAIPDEWLQTLRKREYLEAVCARFARHARPGGFSLSL